MEPFRHPILTVVSYLVFAASIALEAHVYRRRRGKPYPWAESGASLVVMLLHLLSGIIVQLVIVGVFAAIVWHWRIYTMPLAPIPRVATRPAAGPGRRAARTAAPRR